MKDPEYEPKITLTVNILDINTDLLSIDKVKMAITKLKNGKAADIDQISAEEVRTLTILTNILQKIWE